MSPQDQIERVLKEIHLTFAKAQMYENQPDKIVVDRREFLNLLDRLNQGIFDMMDKYEQTKASRDQAEREFKKRSEEIIDNASARADDVYAASVIYAGDAIDRIRGLMDKTNDSMNYLFMQFKKELKEQRDELRRNETELRSQLTDLQDTEKYLSIIEDINRGRKKQTIDDKALAEAGEKPEEKAPYVPETREEAKAHKTAKPMAEKPKRKSGGEKPEVIVNQNSPYFRWKAEQARLEEEREDLPEEVLEAEEAETEETAPDAALDKELSQEEELAAIEAEDRELPPLDLDLNLDLDDEPSDYGDGENLYPNPDFPDEESIRQAVLEDELKQEAEKLGTAKENVTAGKLLKSLVFGKD